MWHKDWNGGVSTDEAFLGMAVIVQRVFLSFPWEIGPAASHIPSHHYCWAMNVCQHPLPTAPSPHAEPFAGFQGAARGSGGHCLLPGFSAAAVHALVKSLPASLHIGGSSCCSSLGNNRGLLAPRCGYFVHEPWDCHLWGIACGNAHFIFSRGSFVFYELNLFPHSVSTGFLMLQGLLGPAGKASQWLLKMASSPLAPCPLPCPKSPYLINSLWIRQSWVYCWPPGNAKVLAASP